MKTCAFRSFIIASVLFGVILVNSAADNIPVPTLTGIAVGTISVFCACRWQELLYQRNDSSPKAGIIVTMSWFAGALIAGGAYLLYHAMISMPFTMPDTWYWAY